MENNSNYVKVLFKTSNQTYTSCQIKNDNLIPKDYEPLKLVQTLNDNTQQYTLFADWVEEQTQKKLIKVPTIDVTLVPQFYVVTLSYNKNQVITNLVGNGLNVTLTFNSNKAVYIQNVYSKNGFVFLNDVATNKYKKIENTTQFNLQIPDVTKYANKTLEIEIDLYKDNLYIQKVGTISFPIEIECSNNPPGD